MSSKLYQNPSVATRRSFTKSWTTYCRAHEQSSVQDTKLPWLDSTCSFFCNCLFGAALFQLACLLRLCVLAMKRDAAQTSLPTDGDKEDARQPKHLPPPETTRSFWVENLPPNGLGHGITSACLQHTCDGIVYDLKQIICQELSHPRFYLTKRTFRLKLNGIHQPYYIKLNTMDRADILSPKHFGRKSSSTRVQAVVCNAILAFCVCVCVWTSVTKWTQGFCNNLAHQLIEHAKISSMFLLHSCRGARGLIIQLGPTKLCMMKPGKRTCRPVPGC